MKILFFASASFRCLLSKEKPFKDTFMEKLNQYRENNEEEVYFKETEVSIVHDKLKKE